MQKSGLLTRMSFAILFDGLVAAWTWSFLLLQRYGYTFPPGTEHLIWSTLPLVVLAQIACFGLFRLYRSVWRYSSLHDLHRLAGAVVAAGLFVPPILRTFDLDFGVPRTQYLLFPLLSLACSAGGRLLYRAWIEDIRPSLRRRQQQQHRDAQPLPPGMTRQPRKPVLVLCTAELPLGTLELIDDSRQWRIAGLLLESPRRIGRRISGHQVLGTWDDLARHAADLGCAHAILALPQDLPAARRRASDLCESAQVQLLLVPGINDLMSGRVTVSQMKQFEVVELLGRPQVELDVTGIGGQIAGQVVLVTGAGGSIGSELCRQIAAYHPRLLVLYEVSESALYQISDALQAEFDNPPLAIRSVVGDVKDAARLTEVFTRLGPSVVYHAAAYKHVPMLERDNCWEAVRNNVIGSRVVAEVAARFEVSRFVFISTDKAVNPTNVMGATKRLAEMVLLCLQNLHGLSLVSVRFGNVLGSSGSVIPRFYQQIARGGPVTVTHPEITRYFMSIPEAARLVLQAGLMGGHGELFLLDMGEPVRITDLAAEMIRRSGFTKDEIRIVYSGLRDGEKLFEELLADEENSLPSGHPKLRIARSTEAPGGQWYAQCMAWLDQAQSTPMPPDDDTVRDWLAAMVPSFTPSPGARAAVPPSGPPAHGASGVGLPCPPGS